MCGIFGLIVKPGSAYPEKAIRETVKKLALLSESRGKDSSGVAFRFKKQSAIEILKGDIPVSSLLVSEKYDSFFQQALDEYSKGGGLQVFGHARLVTNGSQLQEENNQPVIKDNMAIIHNGIITNVNELWAANKNIKQDYKIDTEVIPALIAAELKKNPDTITACNESFRKLEGTFSVALMFADSDEFVLATNNGSLYYVTNNSDFIFFASEKHYVSELIESGAFAAFKTNSVKPKQLKTNEGLVIGLNEFKLKPFSLSSQSLAEKNSTAHTPFQIKVHTIENKNFRSEVVIDPMIFIDRTKEAHLYKLLEFNSEAIKKLKRCTKCLNPETFPFIDFDSAGVCNYCRNYKPKNQHKPVSELLKMVEPYRSKNGEPDCIVPFSGGRDSTYALHIIKKELGLNPIAYTYDWGMVTDLARRNIARVCGKLGVEHIIVSADLKWKRENIRKNIEAWLHSPDLGMIPLFMAGDKYFFYYTNRLKKQTGIKLNIWGINYLENTDFKTGFAGLPPQFDKKRIYSLSILSQLKLFGFVAKNILKSPGYLNQSVVDSLGSFAVRYLSPKKDYYHLFDYYRWDEQELEKLILNEYQWEKAIDTNTTWRIGDGTAAFYNYIYYTVAGFSEFDTFRSNQIREGMITREAALKLIEEENRPRYESMRWYLEIVGLDFETVIKRINAIPKLYPF